MDSDVLDILDEIMYATIATADKDGNPWAAPQFIVYNHDAKELYWCASRDSQHAQNILNNGRAFIVVYDSSVGPGKGKGVYFQTSAQIVNDQDDVAMIMERLVKRHQGVPYWTLNDVQDPASPVKVFKAVIEKAWTNDGREQDGRFVLYRKPIDA